MAAGSGQVEQRPGQLAPVAQHGDDGRGILLQDGHVGAAEKEVRRPPRSLRAGLGHGRLVLDADPRDVGGRLLQQGRGAALAGTAGRCAVSAGMVMTAGSSCSAGRLRPKDLVQEVVDRHGQGDLHGRPAGHGSHSSKERWQGTRARTAVGRSCPMSLRTLVCFTTNGLLSRTRVKDSCQRPLSTTPANDSMLCYATLYHAMLATLFYARYAMLCYATLPYPMLCYAMLCYAMLCYAMLCYAMLCYAMLRTAPPMRRPHHQSQRHSATHATPSPPIPTAQCNPCHARPTNPNGHANTLASARAKSRQTRSSPFPHSKNKNPSLRIREPKRIASHRLHYQ